MEEKLPGKNTAGIVARHHSAIGAARAGPRCTVINLGLVHVKCRYLANRKLNALGSELIDEMDEVSWQDGPSLL